jgi:hypothetical protein
MDRQQRIHVFSLAAHRIAVQRLRQDPCRLTEAMEVLHRWRTQAGGASSCDPYWDEWERLLRAGPDAVEAAACTGDDRAATLRSASPLGRFLTPAERTRLLRETNTPS